MELQTQSCDIVLVAGGRWKKHADIHGITENADRITEQVVGCDRNLFLEALSNFSWRPDCARLFSFDPNLLPHPPLPKITKIHQPPLHQPH